LLFGEDDVDNRSSNAFDVRGGDTLRAKQQSSERLVVDVQSFRGVSYFNGSGCRSGSGGYVKVEIAILQQCGHECPNPASVPRDFNFRPDPFH
jgi:hypothetical protein